MALNMNSGVMNSTVNSGLHVRQFDQTLYQRMADSSKATFVNFLRILGMKRKAKSMNRSGFVGGGKLKNINGVKYEWQDIFVGTPLSKIVSVAKDTDDPETPSGGADEQVATKITVTSGEGKMFHVNDIILDRNTDERMLVVKKISADVLKVKRAFDTATGIGTLLVAGHDIVLISSAFAEGSFSADARSYNPTQDWNYVQIFKRAVANTGTNEEIDSYGHTNKLGFQRNLEFEQFMIERSRCYFKGIRTEMDDPTSPGRKLRTTAGLDYFLRNNVTTMNSSFTYSKWIDFCEQAFAYNGGERIFVLNDSLMTLIQKELLPNNAGIITEVKKDQSEYGFGFFKLKTHKGRMSLLVDSTMNDLYAAPTGFALDTDLIEEAILRPDVWRENVQTPDYDGRKDEILGECGFKLISPDRHRKLVVNL